MFTRVSVAPASRGRQMGVLEHRGICLPRGAGCRHPGLEQPSCGSTPSPTGRCLQAWSWTPAALSGSAQPCSTPSSSHVGPADGPPCAGPQLLSYRPGSASPGPGAAVRPSLILCPTPTHLILPHIQPSVCLAPRATAQEGRIGVCWHVVGILASVLSVLPGSTCPGPPRLTTRVWCRCAGAVLGRAQTPGPHH